MKNLKVRIECTRKSLTTKLRKSRNARCIVTCVLMLMACQPSTKPVAWNLPANLTQDCPDLPEIELGDGGYVLKAWVKDRRIYVECAQAKRALNQAVKRSSS